MNNNQFLPQDTKEAVAEYRASWTLISRVEESLMKGELGEAKLALNDLSKSIRELERLQSKKERHDELISVIHQLSERGLIVRLGVVG
jgi:hypothetical protein